MSCHKIQKYRNYIFILLFLLVPSIFASTNTTSDLRVTDVNYTCKKVKQFLNDTPNYDLSSIILLQEDIRFEINSVIPFTTLKEYINNYGQFCENHRKIENKTKQQPIQKVSININNNPFQFIGLNWISYIKLPLQVDFGKIDNKNATQIFDFVDIFFPLVISDEENPNAVWEGKLRIIPLLLIMLMIIVIFIAYKNKKLLKEFENIEVGSDNTIPPSKDKGF